MITCFVHNLRVGTSTLSLRRMASQIQRQMSTTKSYMIVGLGNADYPDTRHSVGMRAADRLAEWLGVQWSRQRALQSQVATTHLPECHLHLVLVKPKTFMNINGKSIHKAAHHYGIEASNIYLMHDELDKPIGVAKMKNGGSARGHNGVRSAISSLKSDVMPRLLIGIDRPVDKSHVADYVLERFKPEERRTVDTAITHGLTKLLSHLQTQAGVQGDLIGTIRKDNTAGYGATSPAKRSLHTPAV